MRLIDLYICKRFLANFIILMTLLFLFVVSIDLLLNLDRFVEVGRDRIGEDGGFLQLTWTTIWLASDFEAPRAFLFYGYMHGLVAIGAMAFTLAYMHRHRELVALLASGVSLYRVAMPLVVVMFVISLAQLANQEYLLPRLAPMLLRDHGQVGERTLESFPVPLTPDSHGNIVQSPAFQPDPVHPKLERPTVLEVDDHGRTVRRITADSASWDEAHGQWQLVHGVAVRTTTADDSVGALPAQETIEAFPTDLSPRALTIRRHGQFAAMLSLKEIRDMLAVPGVVDTSLLVRHEYARFAVVLVNLLVLGLTLPTFLLRGPAVLLRQAVLCAAIAVPAMMGAGLGMNIDVPGISPAVGVFLPVIILLLLTMARWTYFRT